MVVTFDGGLLLLKPAIKRLLKQTYENYCYLWDEGMETEMKDFAASNPLTGDIRDKFILYDARTRDLFECHKIVRIECMEIVMNDLFEEFIHFSRKWKTRLGIHLSSIYKKQLIEFVEFITEMDLILHRKIKDLDDIRIAIKALETIRERAIM